MNVVQGRWSFGCGVIRF